MAGSPTEGCELEGWCSVLKERALRIPGKMFGQELAHAKRSSLRCFFLDVVQLCCVVMVSVGVLRLVFVHVPCVLP